MFKWTFFLVIFFSFTLQSIYSQDKQILKLGTLATEGSDWGLILQKMNAELIQKSEDKLQFKFFFGRDEADLIELIKNQQLDAASLTSVGLGQFLPEIYLLYLPMLFSSEKELDYVRNKLTSFYVEKLEERGFNLLGWGDYGAIYLFSKMPIRTQTDLQNTKFWIWTIDPIGQAFASASGNEPILLSIENVLPSLARGEIETVFISPLACIVYQWNNHVKFMTDLPLVMGIGASIINKEHFDRLSKSDRNLLQKITMKYHNQLVEKIRQSNQESLRILQDQGIQIISVPQQEELKWQQLAEKVQNQLAGKFFDKELLDRARAFLTEFSKSKQ